MMEFNEGLQPAAAGILLYLLAWFLWHHGLCPVREDVEAEARAAALLGEVLSEGERRQLARSGYLVVGSPNVASRLYRIPARTGWVDVYESGLPAMRLCLQPGERLPAPDVVLMHKLMIEGNEEEYLRRANVRWRRRV